MHGSSTPRGYRGLPQGDAGAEPASPGCDGEAGPRPPVPARPAPRLDIRHVVLAGRDDHPSAANGVHNVARHLVREQRAAGHDARLVVLCCARNAEGPAPDGTPDPFATLVVPVSGTSVRGHVVRLTRAVADAVLAGAGPHTVFHIHGGRAPLLAGLARRMRARGLPYAVTIHGRFSHVYDGDGACLRRSTALYLRLVEGPMLAGARFVQALSSEEARVLARIAPRARIGIVGNGAWSSRLDAQRPGALPSRQRAAGPVRFASCGRYAIHHKGLDLLLEGFALYRRDGGTGHLTTMGSGPARAELSRLADRLGLADAVLVDGPRYGAERDALLRRADFFVMASRFEGVPLAALEAGLLGLPLLVTRETGLADAVVAAGAGDRIGALTAEAVRDALLRAEAVAAPARARQADAVLRLVEGIGDWTTIAAGLCAHYLDRDGAPARDVARRPAARDGDPLRTA